MENKMKSQSLKRIPRFNNRIIFSTIHKSSTNLHEGCEEREYEKLRNFSTKLTYYSPRDSRKEIIGNNYLRPWRAKELGNGADRPAPGIVNYNIRAKYLAPYLAKKKNILCNAECMEESREISEEIHNSNVLNERIFQQIYSDIPIFAPPPPDPLNPSMETDRLPINLTPIQSPKSTQKQFVVSTPHTEDTKSTQFPSYISKRDEILSMTPNVPINMNYEWSSHSTPRSHAESSVTLGKIVAPSTSIHKKPPLYLNLDKHPNNKGIENEGEDLGALNFIDNIDMKISECDSVDSIGYNNHIHQKGENTSIKHQQISYSPELLNVRKKLLTKIIDTKLPTRNSNCTRNTTNNYRLFHSDWKNSNITKPPLLFESYSSAKKSTPTPKLCIKPHIIRSTTSNSHSQPPSKLHQSPSIKYIYIYIYIIEKPIIMKENKELGEIPAPIDIKKNRILYRIQDMSIRNIKNVKVSSPQIPKGTSPRLFEQINPRYIKAYLDMSMQTSRTNISPIHNSKITENNLQRKIETRTWATKGNNDNSREKEDENYDIKNFMPKEIDPKLRQMPRVTNEIANLKSTFKDKYFFNSKLDKILHLHCGCTLTQVQRLSGMKVDPKLDTGEEKINIFE